MSNSSEKEKILPCLDIRQTLIFDIKNPIVIFYGDTSDDYRNECDGKGWITRDTFLPHMQTTTLKVRLENGKVLSATGLILPCALEELGCETTR